MNSTVLIRRMQVLVCAGCISTGALAVDAIWQGDDSQDPTLWNVAENWNTGLLPTSTEIAKFLGSSDFAEVVAGDDFTVHRVWAGWGDDNVHIIVHAGGSLTTTSWMGIGVYGGAEALLEIDGGTVQAAMHRTARHGSTLENLNDSTLLINSGTYTVTGNASLGEEHVGVNYPGIARLIMNGGTMNVGGLLTSYNPDIASNGISPNVMIDLNDGVLDVGGLNSNFIGNPDKLIDIDYGTWIIGGDRRRTIDAMITAGELIGFGGAGTVVYDYNDTLSYQTTVTATHPLNPSPEHKSLVLATGGSDTVTMSWDNIDPNTAGATVTADVWFGTDSNKSGPNYSKIVDGLDVTGVARSSSTPQAIAADTTYYWQVDFNNGSGSMIEGDVFEFLAVDNTEPQISIPSGVNAWLDEITGIAVISVNATVIDDSPELTYAWTFFPAGDPNVVFDSTAIEDPTLTIDAPGVWTVTLTVDDGYWKKSASSQIRVSENPCQVARHAPGYPGDPPGDITDNCVVDLTDFAVFALTWLDNPA